MINPLRGVRDGIHHQQARRNGGDKNGVADALRFSFDGAVFAVCREDVIKCRIIEQKRKVVDNLKQKPG